MRHALVLIHGYPFDRTMWDGVIKQLEAQIKVIIAPDLPGFGSRPVLPTEPSLDRMADFIAETMDAARVSHAIVAGMSMGGYVALSFAELYPERLAGLALVASQSAADTEEARQGRRTIIESVKKEGPPIAAAAALPKLFAPKNSQNESFLKYPREGASQAGVKGITWALEAMARRPDRTFIFHELECPILILHGREDKFIPIAKAAQMAKEIPHSRFVEIPTAGHASPIEEPLIVAEELAKLCDAADHFTPHPKERNRPPITIAPTPQGL